MKVLIVIDMQNDFITGVFGTEEAKAIVPKVVAKIKEAEDEFEPLFYTQDTHMEEYYQDTAEANLPIHCILGTEGWLIEQSVQEAIDSFTKYCEHPYPFEKHTFGSCDLSCKINDLASEILSSDLNFGVLPQTHKQVIEIVGLCTDICVISNALMIKAAIPWAEIIVDASACAGTTPENHNKALDIMELNGIKVINR